MVSGQKTILLIEDEKELADVFGLKLRAEGYNVLNADDGAKGVEMMKESKPDLVLMDLVMPNCDGYKALEQIKKDKSIKDITVCAWSNLTQEDEIEKAKKLGADHYLIKSDYTPSKLAEKVKELLKK